MNKMLDHITDDPFGFDPEAEAEYLDDLSSKLEYEKNHYNDSQLELNFNND